jgi:hypothetical protein
MKVRTSSKNERSGCQADLMFADCLSNLIGDLVEYLFVAVGRY